MRQTTTLDSDWQVRWCDYQRHTSLWSRPEEYEKAYIPAAVPGDVHLDLMRAGVLPDPFVKLNTDACLWMEQCDFWYRRKLQLPAGWVGKKHTAIKLRFHGIDCFGSVYWDGAEIGSHANMFTPLELDLTARAKQGAEHRLEVRLGAPLFEAVKRHPNEQAVATTWGFPRHISRKAAMSYGWDIAPRLVTTGLWRPVELILVDRARLNDVWLRTRDIKFEKSGAASAAKMQAQIEIDRVASCADLPLTVVLEFTAPGGSGRTVLRCELPAGKNLAVFDWTLDQPQLWWPNGSGDPTLYPVKIRLLAGEELLDERRTHFGVRTVQLDRSKTPDGGHRYTFIVNGREIFMRGWNWTPPDAIFARITTERRQKLVALAKASNANMLRIWGGGYYEPQEFFDACDRAGLLVHSDFMMACAQYPQSDAFQTEIRAEAEFIVREYRSHPSMALWSGDNECDGLYADPSKNVITRKTLPAVVKRLDPDTPYIVSSPDSPGGRMYNDTNDSDAHLWWHGQTWTHDYYVKARAKFVSEIGFLSLPGHATAQALLGGDAGWPADNAIWDHHAADTMRGKMFRGMPYVLKNFDVCGKPRPKTLDEYIRVSQELQAAAYKFWALHFGGRSDCAGILLWNLADCWPQMSDAVIAYPWDEKPALKAAAEAFAAIGRW
ncbi:MAG: glycoside hydrolase family 2 protein [Planctomycetota bacterium]